jgi:predicted histone-like DNA-binding protein
MSIKYKMIGRKDYLNPEGHKKEGVYPQIVRTKTVKIDDLADEMAQGKRFQAYELKGTVLQLLDTIEKELLNGNSVCLDGFGTFSLTAQSKRTATDPDEIRAESIEVKRVVFTPSSPLRQRMKVAKFVRVNS